MTNLKLCPFCGKNVAIISDVQDCELCSNFEEQNCPQFEDIGHCNMKLVCCNAQQGGCGASTGWYATEQEAVEAWNRSTKE